MQDTVHLTQGLEHPGTGWGLNPALILHVARKNIPIHFSYHHNTSVALLGLSVDGGYDSSSGRGGGLLLGLLSQVLADIGRGVGAFQFRLLPLSLRVDVRLSWLWWFLLDCWRCGGRGLGNGDLRRVQVHAVGWRMVVSVGPRHCVKELVEEGG